jgi:hypothetical protein
MFSWFIDNFDRITQSICRVHKIGKTKYELHKKVTRAGRRKLTDAKKNISIPELAYYLKLEASKTN